MSNKLNIGHQLDPDGDWKNPSILQSRLLAVAFIVVANIVWFSITANASSTFSGKRLSKAAIMLVQEKFGESLEVSIPLPPSDQYFDTDEIEAEIIVNSKTIARHLYLTALFYEQGELLKKVDITAQVAHKVLIPVANSNLRQGEKITAAHIDFQPIDRFSIATSVISSDKGLIGMTLLKDIKSGESFPSESLTSGKKVKRGEEIELVVIKGTVKVRASATALEDGLPGQTIRLERQGSKKIISATISQEGKAILAN